MRDYLLELRNKNGYSQQYVANELGITSQYYQMIESGERQKNMNFTLIYGLSKVFGVSIQHIFDQEKKFRCTL